MSDQEEQQQQQQEEEQEQQQQQSAGSSSKAKKGKAKRPALPTRSTAKKAALDATSVSGQDLKRRVKNAKFSAAIHKRGSQQVSGKPVEEDDKPVIGPFTLAILIFVVCGSAIFGVAQTLMNT